MKKKVRNPTYHIGDKVQITNPEFFERCGFELTLQKIRDNEGYNKAVETKVSELLQDKSAPWYHTGFDSKSADTIKRTLYYNILKAQDFGGKERKIYNIKDNVSRENVVYHTVISKKIVRTGIYSAGRIKGKNNVILYLQTKEGYWNTWIEAKNVRLLKKQELALMQ